MKVCLINPPDGNKREKNMDYCETAYNFPHLGLGYIASVLDNNNISVEVIECMGMDISLEKLYKKIKDEQYGIIGISSYVYNSFNVIKIVKEINKIDPNIFVFLGGYYATFCYETILKNISGINCCVLGEGELTCLELVKAISMGKTFEQVAGIAYIENGKIIKTNPRHLIDDLDTLPFPKRAFVSSKGMGSMVTSRGCYGNCAFCSIKTFYENQPGIKIRYRSAKNVVQEIEHLIKNLGVRFINIYDDNFLISSSNNLNRVKEICQLIKEKQLIFKFTISARATDIIKNKILLTELKSIGLEYVFVGIESMVDRQLEFYNKNTTSEQNCLAIKTLIGAGIKIAIGFIILDPFTSLDEIVSNVNILRGTNYVDHMYEVAFPVSLYSALQPVHGTPFYNTMQNKGLLKNKELGYDFEDDRVSLFYKIKKKWSEALYNVNIETYIIFELRDNGYHELEKILAEEKKKLVLLDMLFIESLCLKITNEAKILDDLQIQNFLDEWIFKLEPIQNKFTDAKVSLGQ